MRKILAIVLFHFCICASACAKSVFCTNVDSLVNENIYFVDSILKKNNGYIRFRDHLKYHADKLSELTYFLLVMNLLAGYNEFEFYDDPHDPTFNDEKFEILKAWLLEYKDYITCDSINSAYKFILTPIDVDLDEDISKSLDEYTKKAESFRIIKY